MIELGKLSLLVGSVPMTWLALDGGPWAVSWWYYPALLAGMGVYALLHKL